MIFVIQIGKEVLLMQERCPIFRAYSNEFKHTVCQWRERFSQIYEGWNFNNGNYLFI